MLNEKSVPVPQMALVNLKRINTATETQPTTDSMVRWLKSNETQDTVTGDNTHATRQESDARSESSASSESDARSESVPSTKSHPTTRSCPEPSKDANGVSSKYVKKLRRRVEMLEKQVEEAHSENRHLRQKVQNLQRSDNEAKHTVSELSKELAFAQRKQQTTEQRLRKSTGKELQLRRTSNQLTERVRDLEHENADLVDEMASLTADVESLHAKVRYLQQELAGRRRDVTEDVVGIAEDETANVATGETLPGDSQRDRSVVDEELGFLTEENGVCVFQSANGSDAAERLSADVVGGFEMGDTVKRILWSDGHVDLVPLQYRRAPRILAARSFPRKRRTVRVRSNEGVELCTEHRAVRPLTGDIVIVGGDCPTRYTDALSHFGHKVLWHSGFGQREKLEQMLRKASLVVTIETQMSHAAMWRVKHLAKAGQFRWRHVKVKSLSSVRNAILSVTEAAESLVRA